MKRYMLDTDTSSHIIRSRPESVRVRFGKLDSSQSCISVITHAELLYGVKSAASSRTIRPAIEDFVRRLTVLDWDSTAAEHYADIRVRLETGGTPIGNMDLMIAAHARSVSAVLVTNNEKHFRRVSGLSVENWV